MATLAGAGSASGTTGADSFTLSSGTLSGTVNLGAGGDTFAMSGGTLSGTVNLGANNDTFTYTGGTLSGSVDLGANNDTLTVSASFASGGSISGGTGTDTIAVDYSGNTPITFDATNLTNFEAMTKSGTGTVTQSGTLPVLDGGLTISGGKYTIGSGATLNLRGTYHDGTDFVGNNTALTMTGGELDGSGTLTFIGYVDFVWSGGTLSRALSLNPNERDARVFLSAGSGTFGAGGAVSAGQSESQNEIIVRGDDNFDLDGTKFTGFDELRKEGASTVTLTGSLRLHLSVTDFESKINAGTFIVASGVNLRVGALTIKNAGSKLVLAGTFSSDSDGTISGDSAGQVLEIYRANAFAVNVDLKGGTDTLIINTSNGDITFSATQAGYYMNIETMEISGGNDVTWQEDLTFDDVDGDWQSLKISDSGVTFKAGAATNGMLTFNDGAIIDLSGLPFITGGSVKVTADMITLPTTSTSGGLKIIIPSDLVGMVTLTLENVKGDNAATEMSVLALFSAEDAKSTPTAGDISVSGTTPDYTASTYTLVLQIELSLGVLATTNTSGTFTLTSGRYRAAFPAITAADAVTNLVIDGGAFIPAGGAALLGDSQVTWNDGVIGSTIDASDGTGLDTIQLSPATGTEFRLSGAGFVGFEKLIKDGAGSVNQSGTLTLGGALSSFAISAGSYGVDGTLVVSSLTISGTGELTGSGSIAFTTGADSVSLTGGTLSLSIDTGAGADTFTWGAGTFGTGVRVDLGGGSDVITLEQSTDFTLDLSRFSNFEGLSITGSAAVTQSSALTLESFAISAGSYAVNAALVVNSLTIDGGTLSGSSTLTFAAGVNTFTMSGGTLSLAVDLGAGADRFVVSGTVTISGSGAVEGDTGTDTIEVTGATDFTVDYSSMTGFEALTKTGSNTATQSGAGTFDSLTVSAGTYDVASTGTLTIDDLTISGTGTLSGAGTLTFAAGVNAFTMSGGTLSLAVDLGAGDDAFA